MPSRRPAVAENATQLAGTSNNKIGYLRTAAAEIGKVIEVIQDIAEQTNLLALNATIEAARPETPARALPSWPPKSRNWPSQTATATEDIRRRIEGIQGSTTEAVQSIGKSAR